ncbi:TP53-target gene 5 protein isoform X2 [Diceros bicornis minor]|uniref:TP53-target gene 5 protein isoform X2 n=1 Tax=Diceros bicornis minor TaxID=77932 RepID=UPI0026EDEB84|nr:TP53-target gene 5 protein isoform X2 [Diceros bicornis minor]
MKGEGDEVSMEADQHHKKWKGSSGGRKNTIPERNLDLPKEMKISGNGKKKMQDKEPQDKIQQPVSKVLERNRLKMVLKNLSLLRLLKSSNPRIQELYSLAKRCWNSLLRVPKILRISSGNNDGCDKVEQNNEELQEAGCSKKKLESKKLESIEEEEEAASPKETQPMEEVGQKNKAQQSPAAVPQKEEQVEPEVPTTSRSHGLTPCPGAQRKQPPTGGSRVVFLKTYLHRTPMEDGKQLEAANQWVWFEGLPTRVHLPGPRVMCRSSTLRWVKRCCTRFCSASLELPMCHPYRV